MEFHRDYSLREKDLELFEHHIREHFVVFVAVDYEAHDDHAYDDDDDFVWVSKIHPKIR